MHTPVDSALEAVVRESTGKAEGGITLTDLLQVKSVNAPDKNITTLAGLEYATELQVLNLLRNSISDLTPLRDLPRLSAIYISGTTLDSETSETLKGLEQRGIQVITTTIPKQLETLTVVPTVFDVTIEDPGDSDLLVTPLPGIQLQWPLSPFADDLLKDYQAEVTEDPLEWSPLNLEATRQIGEVFVLDLPVSPEESPSRYFRVGPAWLFDR